MNTCSSCRLAALCVAGWVLGKRAGRCGECAVGSQGPLCHNSRIYQCTCGQLWDVAFTGDDVGEQALLTSFEKDGWNRKWFGTMTCCAKCKDKFGGEYGRHVVVELCGLCGCASLMPGEVNVSLRDGCVEWEVRLVCVAEWTSWRARGLAERGERRKR